MSEQINAPEQAPVTTAAEPAAPQNNSTGVVKITVSQPPKKDKNHKRRNPEDARAMAAKAHAWRESVLTNAGYAPEATVAIMRYLQSKGDAKGIFFRDQDDCVRIFRNISERLMYSIPTFDRMMSSAIVLTFISIVDKLYAGREAVKDMSAEDSTTYACDIIKSLWSKKMTNSSKLLDCILFSINKKRPEGFLRRARIFFECAIDASMNMVDPFEGMFHDKPLQMPKEMKDRIEAARQAKAPQADCPKCGQRMMYHFKMARHFCMNKECENYRPPRPKGQRKDGDHRDEHKKRDASAPQRDGWHFKGDAGAKSASDKFREKYSKFSKKDKVKPAAPEAPAMVKDAKTGKMRSFTAGSFDALDALKLS